MTASQDGLELRQSGVGGLYTSRSSSTGSGTAPHVGHLAVADDRTEGLLCPRVPPVQVDLQARTAQWLVYLAACPQPGTSPRCSASIQCTRQ